MTVRFMGIIYRNGYFQTWGFSCRLRKIPFVGEKVYDFTRWLCGKATGHTPSRTEWGYGGGGYADVWCRWCNQIGQIPRSELEDRFANARATVWQAFQCDIRRPYRGEPLNGLDSHHDASRSQE